MHRSTYRFHECEHIHESVKMLVSKAGTPEEKMHPIAKCDHCGQLREVADPSDFVRMIRDDAEESS